jgi:hypothetical protein
VQRLEGVRLLREQAAKRAEEDSESSLGRRRIGFVLMFAGVASAAAGGVFGYLGKSNNDTVQGTTFPTVDALSSQISTGKTYNLVAYGTLALAAVLEAVALPLILANPAPSAPAAAGEASR